MRTGGVLTMTLSTGTRRRRGIGRERYDVPMTIKASAARACHSNGEEDADKRECAPSRLLLVHVVVFWKRVPGIALRHVLMLPSPDRQHAARSIARAALMPSKGSVD